MSSGLVIAQFVVAIVLLVGAGLMAKNFVHLVTVYQGLQPSQVATMQVSLPQSSSGDNDPRIVIL